MALGYVWMLLARRRKLGWLAVLRRADSCLCCRCSNAGTVEIGFGAAARGELVPGHWRRVIALQEEELYRKDKRSIPWNMGTSRAMDGQGEMEKTSETTQQQSNRPAHSSARAKASHQSSSLACVADLRIEPFA